MKTYNVNLLSSIDVSMMRNIINDIGEMFSSKDFKEFILEKCERALDNICSMNMPFPEGLDTLYMLGMKTRIDNDEIELYNDKQLKQNTLVNYR